jgi:hypothetical protein
MRQLDFAGPRRAAPLWFIWLVLALCASLLPRPAQALQSGRCGKGDCSIAVTQLAPNVERVDITRPVVSSSVFDYKTIVFRSGDQVGIFADGCVQTGGAGSTWKRYVNPSGANSDRLYFGSMEIPGALRSTRFSALLGRTITLPAIEPTTLVLRYADDNYGDNGYGGHDNGTQNQCAGPTGGPARVTLIITHATNPPPPPPPPRCTSPVPPAARPWDLAAGLSRPEQPADDNCLPLNPRWLWQTPDVATVPEFTPSLATQITGTDNSHSCSWKGQPGHTNWIAATYTGVIEWFGHDYNWPAGDDDYNVRLSGSPIGETIFMPGGTQHNPDTIKGEFDSDETIDHFDQSPWWRRFHAAVDADGHNTHGVGSRASGLIDGHDAVITGLMGLDTFHSDNKSELHPVHALAIRIADSPNTSDDGWAIFARNSGNQGYCGTNQHYVSRTAIKVRIPRPDGLSPEARPRSIANRFFGYNIRNLGRPYDVLVRWFRGGDALVTFFLNTPTAQSYIFGELHLEWFVPASASAQGAAQSAPMRSAARDANGKVRTNARTAAVAQVDDDEESGGPEESAEERELWNSLTPGQRAEIERMINAALPPEQPVIEEVRVVDSDEPPEEDNEGVTVFEGTDEATDRMRDVSYGALCTVTGGVTPTLPGLCRATTSIAGDLNGDRIVNTVDLDVLRPSIGRSVVQSPCGYRCDLDQDGRITDHDARKLVTLCTVPGCGAPHHGDGGKPRHDHDRDHDRDHDGKKHDRHVDGKPHDDADRDDHGHVKRGKDRS